MDISKEQFIYILKFLAGFAGMEDLYQPEVQEEYWNYFEKEKHES